jgi:hypothetical protein
MKKLIALFFLLGLKNQGWSQGAGNFFSQSETDIRSMSEQIAALQTYIEIAGKGYGIAKKGLAIIGDLKKGEFDLHSSYFGSLRIVNPNIQGYSRVCDIISCILSITTGFKNNTHFKNLTSSEINYLRWVYDNMAAACAKSLAALTDLITDNTYLLYDNERIWGIETIYNDIKEKYSFSRVFLEGADILSAQRQKEWNQISLLKKLE